MVWGCISHDCKLDLVTIQGNLTGDQYIRVVLQPVVVSHFDNHSLATRHVRPQPCIISLQLNVGCSVVIAAAIPDAMLLPTDGCFAQGVPEPVCDGLACPNYVPWDFWRHNNTAYAPRNIQSTVPYGEGSVMV
jgi:hypothetical protein